MQKAQQVLIARLITMEESMGFEPMERHKRSADFKSAAFDHSANSPIFTYSTYYKEYRTPLQLVCNVHCILVQHCLILYYYLCLSNQV